MCFRFKAIISAVPTRGAGIATRYGLDGQGIESRWRQDYPHISRPALGPTQPPGTGSFPGAKRQRRGVNQPPTSSAEDKERVELYLQSPYEYSWPVIRWNLTVSNRDINCLIWCFPDRASYYKFVFIYELDAQFLYSVIYIYILQNKGIVHQVGK
jgi:hypothetical protein